MTLHISTGGSAVLGRHIAHCPTCVRRRRFVSHFQLWYGARFTCCSCGDSWADGERLPRPFARAWRPKAAAEAKTKWDNALAGAELRDARWDLMRTEMEAIAA